MVSGLTFSGANIQYYLAAPNGNTYVVSRVARDNLPANEFSYHYHLQNVNWSEHTDCGIGFANNKAIGTKIYYKLASKVLYESPEAKQKKIADELNSKISRLTDELQATEKKQREAASANSDLAKSNEQLQKEVAALRQDINALLGLLTK